MVFSLKKAIHSFTDYDISPIHSFTQSLLSPILTWFVPSMFTTLFEIWFLDSPVFLPRAIIQDRSIGSKNSDSQIGDAGSHTRIARTHNRLSCVNVIFQKKRRQLLIWLEATCGSVKETLEWYIFRPRDMSLSETRLTCWTSCCEHILWSSVNHLPVCSLVCQIVSNMVHLVHVFNDLFGILNWKVIFLFCFISFWQT